MVVAAERPDARARQRLAGVVAGLAVLANSRLLLLPLVLAVFVAWDVRPAAALPSPGAVLVGAAALAVVPWVVRNQASVGCFTLTTDARALWKANNPATYEILASRRSGSTRCPSCPGAPPWPELRGRS